MDMPRLPIHDALPDLLDALRRAPRAVLQAPPGAGKTTVVPLALLDAGLTPGKIVMLEPRRLAARAAAERMAETLGETPGQTVGYRIRGEARSSAATRIACFLLGLLPGGVAPLGSGTNCRRSRPNARSAAAATAWPAC